MTSNATPQHLIEKHALVLSFWLAFGFAGLLLIQMGFRNSDALVTLLGFAVLVAGFIAHILVNAFYAVEFTRREAALGLVLYSLGLLAFLAFSVFSDAVSRINFITGTIGLFTLFAAVVAFMIIRYGLRKSFNIFDVIRKF